MIPHILQVGAARARTGRRLEAGVREGGHKTRGDVDKNTLASGWEPEGGSTKGKRARTVWRSTRWWAEKEKIREC